PARGWRGDLRVPADDVSLQSDDRRLAPGVGGLDQLRQPLLPAERRGEPECLRCRVRRAADRNLPGRPGALAPRQPAGMEEPAALREDPGARGIPARIADVES